MNFKLNKSNEQYRAPKVKITNNGINVDPEKVRVIVKMPSFIDESEV